MKLIDIALLNLRRRKAKAAFILAGLMIGVATVVGLISLTHTLTMEINHNLEKYGANILITPKSEQLSLSYGGLSLGGFSFETNEIRQSDLAGIKGIKNAANVAAVGPMVLGPVMVSGHKALLAGVDFEAAAFLKPWWKIQGSQPGPGQVLLGAEAARLLGLGQGQELNLKGHRLTVSGVLEPTGSQDDSLLFMPLPAAQQILGKPGLISMVEVAALCKDCPVDDMVAQIQEVLPGTKVMAIQSVVKGRMETVKHFRNLSLGISALLILVGSLVVLVTMMGNVRERTGEIGIFRAIGFRQSHIMRVILWEAALLSLLAGVLGYLAGLGGGQLALPLFSSSHGLWLGFDPFLAGGAVLFSLLIGTIAGLYPAIMAARLDPQRALLTL